MSELNWDAIDPARSRLRLLVASVAREVELVDEANPGEAKALSSAWARLVAELDLGVEPLLRDCPLCRRSILRAAVRCRYCMGRLPPASGDASGAKR